MASITQRGKSYLIRVSDGFDLEGNRKSFAMTWTPEPKMTSRQIEKELARVAIEFEDSVKRGKIIRDAKMRFADWCPIYLQNVSGRLAPSTYQSYEKVIENYLNPAFGAMKLKDIHPQHVQSFVRNLQEPTAGIQHKLSPSTIKRVYSVLQAILHNACKLGYIPENPATRDRIELPSTDDPEVDIFTKEEIERILDLLQNEPLMYQSLINLAIITGCRRGELVALKWEDVDFKSLVVSINKSNYISKANGIQTKSPKTSGSIRLVAIPPFCAELLKRYRREQKAERIRLGDQWIDEDWIFTQWNGAPMYPTTPTAWFSEFLKRHELPHRKFHALRHTSATLLLVNGADIKTVGSRLGHRKLSTTKRYVHKVESADVAAANAFETMFAGKETDGQKKKA